MANTEVHHSAPDFQMEQDILQMIVAYTRKMFDLLNTEWEKREKAGTLMLDEGSDILTVDQTVNRDELYRQHRAVTRMTLGQIEQALQRIIQAETMKFPQREYQCRVYEDPAQMNVHMQVRVRVRKGTRYNTYVNDLVRSAEDMKAILAAAEKTREENQRRFALQQKFNELTKVDEVQSFEDGLKKLEEQK